MTLYTYTFFVKRNKKQVKEIIRPFVLLIHKIEDPTYNAICHAICITCICTCICPSETYSRDCGAHQRGCCCLDLQAQARP